jgi:hypothetical protein
MILPLDKLLSLKENKYVFTKACMAAVDKKDKIHDFPENLPAWKTVPVILRLVLDDKVHIDNTVVEVKDDSEA